MQSAALNCCRFPMTCCCLSFPAPNCPAAYKQFQSETKVQNIGNKEKVTVKELPEVMRPAPQHKEKNLRFQLHLELIEKALKEFDFRNLEPLTTTEQVRTYIHTCSM